MSNLLHSFSLSLLLFPVFFFLLISVAGQSNDTRYPHCPSYGCGYINISYPFWRIGSETNTQFCGHPGFGVNCSYEDGRLPIPSITLGNDSYYIRSIAYDSNSTVIVDYDVSTVVPPDICPRVRHNISIETLPLVFVERIVNLSFHFNCNGVPNFSTEIPCLSAGANKSCVNDVRSNPADFSWDDYSCEDHVETSVFSSFALNSESIQWEEIIQALRRGFELRWGRTEDCEKCEESDGRCGYNHNQDTEESESEFMCFCPGGTITMDHCKGSSPIFTRRTKAVLGAGSALLWIGLIFIIIYCIRKSSSNNSCVALFKQQTEDDKSVETFVRQYGSLGTKRYTYVDIKKMTNSFRVKLGQGGFGTVFKGKLSDGRLVAVKILNSSKAGGQEFINEVASIGRTCHVNIVTLLGFCFDHKKKALVYEFMPNGSLEKFIYGHVPQSTREHIGVDKLYEITLGIARGLEYLHRGCKTRILHLDIKPHNILLDEEFCPKIADFGLAKLYSRKESIVSMLEARGTIGYIAPEVFNRNFGGVSHKSDVYSYGMLILEMVGGRKNVDAGLGSGHTSEIYFPYWIYSRLKNEDQFLLDNVTTVEENDYARKMTIVGLWCIQSDPRKRPSINEAIEMLEGSMEALEIPPKPFFSSPPRSPTTELNTSQEDNYNSREA